jgi:hypothetical protein
MAQDINDAGLDMREEPAMNKQKRNPPTWQWERRLCRHAGVTMLAATVLAALAVVPARAAGSCTGTYITSALEEIPQSTRVGLDPRERTPTSVAADERFLAGMQAAGARVQENSDLRLRLVFSVIQGMTSTTSEAPADAEVYNDSTWLDPSLRIRSKQPGSIVLTAQVMNVSTASITWVASIRCDIRTSDGGALAEDLGRVVGATLWKSVPNGLVR